MVELGVRAFAVLDFLSADDIEFLFPGNEDDSVKLEGCQERTCKGANAFTCHVHPAPRIVLCPSFFGLSSIDQQAVVIFHEAAHKSLKYTHKAWQERDIKYFDERIVEVECYEALVADFFGFSTGDDYCKPLTF